MINVARSSPRLATAADRRHGAVVITVPHELLGREVDLGEVHVTREMIAAYARAVGDDAWLSQPSDEAPATFCLTLRHGMTPAIPLPAGSFGVYGGHELEFHQPIRAGRTYRMSARILDVYEKSGRSGALTVIVREGVIRDARDARDASGQPAVRITEQEIIRRRPAGQPP